MAKTWKEKYNTYEEEVTGTTTGITAFAGGGQASATALTSQWNSVDTVATNYDSVKLAAALIGKKQHVFNNTTKILSLYPISGEYVNNMLNPRINLQPKEVLIVECQIAAKWVIVSECGRGVNNLKTIAYTIGVPGTTGVDYNFTAAANHLEQSIQLGDMAIIPPDALVQTIVIKCLDGLNGVAIGTADVGLTSGSNEYIDMANVDDTNEFKAAEGAASFALGVQISTSATSIYFSFDPDTNWDALTTGKWKIWISFFDNNMV